MTNIKYLERLNIMGRLFGTDGVRGIANIELTAELAYNLGKAGAYVLAGETKHSPRILIGMDTRISGDMLENALVSGVCSVGAEAICLGVVPTPAIAYLTRFYGADAGIVISASHNPFEFNGIKFFDGNGFKLPDSIEEHIENIILDNSEEIPKVTGEKLGKRTNKEDALHDYTEYLKSTIDCDLMGIKVILDCANGAAFEVAPRLFRELGAEVEVINCEPNGVNINRNCGSTHMQDLCNLVKEKHAHVGLAFDGDADRVLAVDETGNIVDGDQIMAIIGLDMKKNGRLPNDTIVVTVMSNLGFDIMAKKERVNVAKTNVGDRCVLEEMKNNGYVIGGEQSGHVILLQYNTTGDGALTGLHLLKVFKHSGKKISELASVMQILPQVLKNAKVSNANKNKYMEDEVIAQKCKELESEFHGEGRVLIRPSGTEPLVRVMIEGKDSKYITERAEELTKIIEERLG